MTKTALDRFVAAVRSDWGPISSALVAQCRGHLDALTAADPSEAWLGSLLTERPATRELHREQDSFMLLAHSEQLGLYRPPHDHGRAWVVYAVQSGALEVGSYVRVPDVAGDRLALAGSHGTWRGELERCRNEFLWAFRSLKRPSFYFCSQCKNGGNPPFL